MNTYQKKSNTSFIMKPMPSVKLSFPPNKCQVELNLCLQSVASFLPFAFLIPLSFFGYMKNEKQ